MADPLGILRQPLVPLAPDPAFAARLRARIQRALIEGATMPASRELAETEGDLAYFSLQVDNAARARQFYTAVLGWSFGADDELGHSAQVEGQALPSGIWDGPPPPGVRKPGVLLVHRVTNLPASVAAVRALGGTASEPHRESYGLAAECVDDQGNGFTLLEMPPEMPRPSINGGRAGDVAYITISPGDEVRASEFLGSLFGWEFSRGSVAHGRQVSGPTPMMGLWGGPGRPLVTLMYLVDDIVEAVGRVRAAGGTATKPDQQPYGITSDCVDDQGMAFALGQL